MISLILGLVLVVGLPLSLKKHIEYVYDRDDLTELQRTKKILYFTIFMTLVTIAVLGTIEFLIGMGL